MWSEKEDENVPAELVGVVRREGGVQRVLAEWESLEE